MDEVTEDPDEPEGEEERCYQLPDAAAGERVDKALAEAGLSRTTVQRLIQEGRVWLDDALVTTASRKLVGGERVRLLIPAPVALERVEPEDIPLAVLFEDPHLIVLDKPAGLAVHPGAGLTHGTLVNALLHHCGDQLSGVGGVIRPGIVHRLDKETSGVLVVAKDDLTHQGLAAQFHDHRVERRYLAIIKGMPRPPRGSVDLPIGRHPTQRQKMAAGVRNGRRAVTHYELLEYLPPFALVACRLETGRTHQIRVHLSHIGHPLLGDPVYGRAYNPPKEWPQAVRRVVAGFSRQALHAETLGFIHPVTRDVLRFVTPPPGDFQELLGELRGMARGVK